MKEKTWTGERVLEARKEAGLTQGEMAEILGCRLQTISEWESGLYSPKNAYRRLLDMHFGNKTERKLR